MDTALHRFIAEVSLSQMAHPAQTASGESRCRSKKAELSRELLEIPYEDSSVSEASTTWSRAAGRTSLLSEFMAAHEAQPLRVLRRRGLCFPTYDVLGEFLSTRPRTSPKTEQQRSRAPRQAAQEGTVIRRKIDLKSYARARLSLEDKENRCQNIPAGAGADKSPRSPCARDGGLADLFEPYQSTPRSRLEPVTEEPSDRE